jgi:hypothetical protein
VSISVGDGISALIPLVLRFRQFTPLPSAARSLGRLSTMFNTGGLADLSDHLGSSWYVSSVFPTGWIVNLCHLQVANCTAPLKSSFYPTMPLRRWMCNLVLNPASCIAR